MTNFRKILHVVLISYAVFSVVACSDSNQGNVSRVTGLHGIKIGMSPSEIRSRLGDPDEENETFWNYNNFGENGRYKLWVNIKKHKIWGINLMSFSDNKEFECMNGIYFHDDHAEVSRKYGVSPSINGDTLNYDFSNVRHYYKINNSNKVYQCGIQDNAGGM